MEEVLKRIILENQEIISGKKLISRNYSIPETDHITVLTIILPFLRPPELVSKIDAVVSKC